jgi:hypothetical protein
MPTRRSFLTVPVLAAAGAGAVAGNAVLGAGRAEAAATTCPESTAGSLSGQSGFITSLADAHTFSTGVPFQGELATICTDIPGGCDRFRRNERVPGETWIRLAQIKGWLNEPENTTPLDWIPGPFEIGQVAIQADGSIRLAKAYHTAYGNGCNYTDQPAAAGSITWDAIDLATGQISGSFDLIFPAGRVAAAFTAPICSLTDCPPRPSKSTCLND